MWMNATVRFGINKLHPAAASDTALMGIGAFRFMWGPVSIGRRFPSFQYALRGHHADKAENGLDLAAFRTTAPRCGLRGKMN